MSISSTEAIKKLILYLPPRRRKQLYFLIILMLFGGLAEIVSLGLIVPFLAFLIDPLKALEVPIVSMAANILAISDTSDLRWTFTIFFAMAAMFSGSLRLLLIATTARIVFGIGHELGAEVYRKAIYQPYSVHIATNSSEIIGGLNKVEPLVFILYGILNATSAALISLAILATLLVISPSFTAITIFGLGGTYAVLMLFTKRRLANNAETISSALDSRVKITQEGLGSIRDIILDQAHGYFINRFNSIDRKFRLAQASNLIIGPSPKFAIEALGMVLIAFFAYVSVSVNDGLTSIIPTLGAMALGAQRLLPLIQLIYTGIVNLKGQEDLVIDVIGLIEQPIENENLRELKALKFSNNIVFEEVGFSFNDSSAKVLQGLSFSISKGNRVGFLGPTGSGKSTALDLLMGLLVPTSGRIVVDGKQLIGEKSLQWQKNISHVPQDLYLLDASFSENIAFGIPVEKIDQVTVVQVAKSADIHEFIIKQPEGYKTVVGERGTRLSGGQRQRIGIARALFKKNQVLVLDEATSALDVETEKSVMSSIDKIDRNITIVMIAHRLTTLKHCDFIYKLEDGKITESINPDSIN